MRIVVFFLLAGWALVGCQADADVALRNSSAPQPFPRFGGARLATDEEVKRAIEIVRAFEAIRGKSHHIATVQAEPFEVSYLMSGDAVVVRWLPAKVILPSPHWGSFATQSYEWTDNPYLYSVELATGSVKVSSDYWLIDSAIDPLWFYTAPAYIESFISRP